MEEKNIYVEIEASNFLRRDILEDAAESLLLLKELEENTGLFEHEELLYKKFKGKINSIKSSIFKFENVLPKINKEEEPKPEIKKKIMVKKSEKPKTEIDLLKNEIDDIERKLKDL